MGADVRSSMSLFPFLHADLPESTPLAGPQDEASRDSLYTNQECFPPVQRSRGPAEDGRFPDRGGYQPVRAQMDQTVDSFFSCRGTAGGGLLAPVVLLPSRVLREPDIP